MFFSRIIRITILTAALMSVITSCPRAQFDGSALEVYESFTENGILPGARAAGMGGAQIASGNDGSALWYNPALLTRIRLTELSAGLSHQKFSNETSLLGGPRIDADVNNTRLSSLWGIFPVPTYQGGLTVGISVNRIKSFDRIFSYATSTAWLDNMGGVDGWGGREDEAGSVWAWSFGGAIEVSPRASVGLSLDIFDGDDDWTFSYDSTALAGGYRLGYEHTIADDYTGISGKIGMTYNANNYLNISGVIGLPASITVDQTSSVFEYDNQGLDATDYSSASYRYTLPLRFGMGAALRYKGLTVAGDVDYADYTQLTYRSGLFDMPRLNMLVKRYYDDVFNFRIGAEYLIEPADVRVRAGYYQEPIAFTGYPVETEPHFFTAGLGFLMERSIKIDLAFLYGSWERDDPSILSAEKYIAKRFMMTVSYRL